MDVATWHDELQYRFTKIKLDFATWNILIFILSLSIVHMPSTIRGVESNSFYLLNINNFFHFEQIVSNTIKWRSLKQNYTPCLIVQLKLNNSSYLCHKKTISPKRKRPPIYKSRIWRAAYNIPPLFWNRVILHCYTCAYMSCKGESQKKHPLLSPLPLLLDRKSVWKRF